jgi:hypothetical protein
VISGFLLPRSKTNNSEFHRSSEVVSWVGGATSLSVVCKLNNQAACPVSPTQGITAKRSSGFSCSEPRVTKEGSLGSFPLWSVRTNNC